MRRLRRLWNILKNTGVDKILIGFGIFVLLMSGVFTVVEPQMKTYGDSLWYSFSVITTVGFGDYYAVTLMGRICTVILGLYALFVVALIPGVMVSYYLDFVQTRAEETMGVFLEKLEHLDELSQEELKELSEKVRNRKDQKS